MPKTKVKPPLETRAELVEQVRQALENKHESPVSALDYLLKFFTNVDLVGIRDDLRRE